MKRIFGYLTCMTAIMGCLWCSGCEADVDLGNIDMSTAVKAELALPIGSIRAELGDFLGDSVIKNLTIDHEGCYVYRDTFYSHKAFHEINVSNYLSETHSMLNIREQLIAGTPELALLPEITLAEDTTFSLDFHLPFVFNGINNSPSSQRVDSIIVSESHFISHIMMEALSTLTWDEITGIDIILNPETFRREEMQVAVPIANAGFGEDIHIDVDDFHLILMKDMHATPSFENIMDSTSFTIRFHIHTKRPHIITEESAISYDFKVDLLDYRAIFGYFQASNLMNDAQADVAIAEYWSGWSELDDFALPMREPSIFIGIEHAIAAPLKVTLSNLSVKSASGEEKFLSFNGATEKSELLEPKIGVTDPLTAHSTDTITIDYTPANGNLGEVMKIHPEKMSYSFVVKEDTSYDMPQYRMTDDTDIKISMGAELPFKFNPGTKIFFADTLDNLQIDRLSLDSLIENVSLIDTIHEAGLVLFLDIENYIPFAVTAELEFLDKTGAVVAFDGLKDIQLAYPKVENYAAIEPGKGQIEIPVGQADLDKLASVGALRYQLTLGDNTDAVDLLESAALKIHIGVKANVDMVLDLNTMFNNDTEETL